MQRIITSVLTVLVLTSITLGQTAFMQLTPGKSTRIDTVRVLGQPVAKVSETMSEHRHSSTGQRLFVQYRPQVETIDRIEVFFDPPMPRAGLASLLGLPDRSDSTKYEEQGSLEEYFGGERMVVLTHQSSEMTSQVVRVGYFSKELFALAMQKPAGQPRPAAPPNSMAANSQPSTASGRTPVKMFKDVDLMVPKGDKSESKSVRMLFDGQYLVIDADGGEKIYKEFPYANIVSAEYSYSSSPRWKTAIGAAVLIGVFALPIFFMKGRKHWLTIKTANDFAILRLDKDNYKMILATFETTVGKKIETVGDEK